MRASPFPSPAGKLDLLNPAAFESCTVGDPGKYRNPQQGLPFPPKLCGQGLQDTQIVDEVVAR
jgi:hypothetical protein